MRREVIQGEFKRHSRVRLVENPDFLEAKLVEFSIASYKNNCVYIFRQHFILQVAAMSEEMETPRTSQSNRRVIVRPLQFDRQTSTERSPMPPLEEGPLDPSPSPYPSVVTSEEQGQVAKRLLESRGAFAENSTMTAIQTDLKLQKLQDQVETLTSELLDGHSCFKSLQVRS